MVINSVSSKTLYNTFPEHDLALSEMYLIEFIIFYNVINMIHSEIKENWVINRFIFYRQSHTTESTTKQHFFDMKTLAAAVST